MSPDDPDICEAIDLRHQLHRFPELSGEERKTAETLASRLAAHGPDQLLRGLGGHGVAAVYEGSAVGPTVLLRCELDGLPIRETGDVSYRSRVEGRGHLCGHDGHAAILTVLAARLGRQRPRRGRAVLLFQPAEETGAGAAAVIADPAFAAISPITPSRSTTGWACRSARLPCGTGRSTAPRAVCGSPFPAEPRTRRCRKTACLRCRRWRG